MTHRFRPLAWVHSFRRALLGLSMGLLLSSCVQPPIAYDVQQSGYLEDYVGLKKDRPTLVVDIDDTLAENTFWSNAALVAGVGSPDKLRHSSLTLGRLADRWNIVYITARDNAFKGRTVDWLNRESFPKAPVIFSSQLLVSDLAQRNYKIKALEYLKTRGLTLGVGVGDKSSDLAAYHAHGMRAFVIVRGVDDRDFVDAFDQREDTLDEHPTAMRSNRDRVFFDPQEAWPAIERELLLLLKGEFGESLTPDRDDPFVEQWDTAAETPEPTDSDQS